ncbi:hypothetical protein KNT89_gp45 [Gordonia phage Petra]|uniref:Uncharacterized protein n=2 Tax=root TaxID=1 RepID=A0A2U8UKQ3_9CAUD|nr:hypothetical protein [Gordonia westfalica]YP_010095439.1 hypothetical protein KNT89_gp45 [Gordonia phage Petra]AWN04158.1 hypothetical protein PBI_PETRA_45 [Gordonia phage Petra]SDU65206.1 hypothetical protein SAMN04488548_1342990 [Gordonia westfalica]
MIATRVILRGPKATLDELAAFVAEARHRGVAGDAAIQFRGATGLGAFAAFSVDVPATTDVPRDRGAGEAVAVTSDLARTVARELIDGPPPAMEEVADVLTGLADQLDGGQS